MASHQLSWRFLVVILLHLLLISKPTAATSSLSHTGVHGEINRPSVYESFAFHGDAGIENGKISLTCANRHCLGVGLALYSHAVRLREPDTNRALSFSSNFTFYMTPLDTDTFGDGLAFFMTPDSSHFGSPRGFLGLYHNEHPHSNHANQCARSGVTTMAVEFRTAPNNFGSNRVVLDICGIPSVASVDADEEAGVNMKSGYKMRVWMEYNGDKEELQVWLSYKRARPRVPLLKTKVNLSRFLHDNMFVGFSASNGEGAALHVVEEWKFQTSPLTSQVPSSWRSLFLTGLGLGIGLVAVLALMVAGVLLCRRRMLSRNRSEDPEKPLGDLPV